VKGFFGNFTVSLTKVARGIDTETCIGCDACIEACPVSVPNEHTGGASERRACHRPYAGALPNVPFIDAASCSRSTGSDCSACAQACFLGAVRLDQKDETLDVDVGAVVLATGADLYDASRLSHLGLGRLPEVYAHYDFELMLSKNGPTQGQIVTRDGRTPNRVAIIHCAGGRSVAHVDHCSATCCLTSFKFAHLIRQQLPSSAVSAFYADLCLPGPGAGALLRSVLDAGEVELVRVQDPALLRVEAAHGALTIGPPEHPGAHAGFDMVVLAVPVVGAADNRQLGELFQVPTDRHGFFQPSSPFLDPVGTTSRGVFAAGSAVGPTDVPGAVARGHAAAGRVLSQLLVGQAIPLDPTIAEADPELCSGCKGCVGLCPYHAIRYDADSHRVSISDVLCQGCGVCAAACPSSAITTRHFTDLQLKAEIAALLHM
jgi:heterodisulfide reductase subunit A